MTGLLYDLATRPPVLYRRAGKGSHPTFLADLTRDGGTWYLYSVAPRSKLVYFVPRRVDALLRDRKPTWFQEKLQQAFGTALHIGAKGYYWSISMSDLASREAEMRRLVDETTQHALRR